MTKNLRDSQVSCFTPIQEMTINDLTGVIEGWFESHNDGEDVFLGHTKTESFNPDSRMFHQALPAASADVVCRAETGKYCQPSLSWRLLIFLGSGKTLAYLIPAIVWVSQGCKPHRATINPKHERVKVAPLILILLPTRELYIQVFHQIPFEI